MITIEQLYEILGLNIINHKICDDLYKINPNIGFCINEIEKRAEKVLDEINNGTDLDGEKVEKIIRTLKSPFEEFRFTIGTSKEDIIKANGPVQADRFLRSVSRTERNFLAKAKAFNSYLVKFEAEKNGEASKSMSVEEFKKYLSEAKNIVNKEFTEIRKNLNSFEDKKTKDSLNSILSLTKSLVDDTNTMKKLIEDNPKVIFDKGELDRDNKVVGLKREEKIQKLAELLELLKKRDYQFPEGVDKDKFYSVCDKYQDWIKKLDLNLNLTTANLWDKLDKPDTETQGQFTDMIKEMKRAKTTFNSSEYNKIIDFLKAINDPEPKRRKDFPLDSEQLYVVKLLTVRKLIRKYINHKVESGVNQNAYKKLAVVEKLYQNISDRLKYLDTEKFEYGRKGKKIVATPLNDPDLPTVEVDLNKVFLTYKSEVSASYLTIKSKNPGFIIPEPLDDSELEKQFAEVKKVHENVDKEEMKNAHNCMSRIIFSAMRQPKFHDKINDLEKQQEKFWNHPVQEISKATIREEQTGGRTLH